MSKPGLNIKALPFIPKNNMVLKQHTPQLIPSHKEITPMSAEELEDQKRMDEFLDSLLEEPTDILNQEEETLFREWILQQETRK